MHRNVSMYVNKHSLVCIYKGMQKGSSLIIAIFILIVVSLLGATLTKVMVTNEQAYAYEVLGARAYNAAQSGVQWKIQQLFPLNNPTDPTSCTAIGTMPDISNVNGLNGCYAEVLCISFVHEETRFYTVTSTGKCNINGEVTSRVVEVEAKSLNLN